MGAGWGEMGWGEAPGQRARLRTGAPRDNGGTVLRRRARPAARFFRESAV